jgi:hypothetical protein
MDDYVRELQDDRKTVVWRARLSDGTEAVMDDGRPGEDPPSAWLRLRERVGNTGVRITGLSLQFRSHQQESILPANADGYFFRKSALGFLTGTETIESYLVGHLTDGRLFVQRWRVPELVLVEETERDPAEAGESLIVNPK